MALAACQLEGGSYTTSIRSRVIQCRPYVPITLPTSPSESGANGKGGKGGKSESGKKAASSPPPAKTESEMKGEEKLYEVQLEQTVLFPEGGGQPSDSGKLGEVPVSYVSRAADGQIWHRTPSPLEPGTEVEAQVDWARRYDHMQQHSGQHLISAVFRSMFGWNTVSWQLATAPSESYVELDAKEISPEQLAQAEAAINEHIRLARPFRVHVFSSVEEASAHPHFRSRPNEVPKTLTAPLRVMEIEGVDFNKCCGTHLRCTSELQMVNFCKTEKGRGHTRVFFWIGARAVQAMARMVAQQRALINLLSTGPEGHAEKVKLLQTDLKALSKLKSALLEEVAAAEADRCVNTEAKYTVVHRDGGDAAYLSSLADAVATRRPDLLLFLTASNGEEKDGAFLVAGPPDAVTAVAPKLEKVIEGRGGGRKGRYQGKATRIDQRAAAATLLATLI